jgi:hypothetical protein
VKITLDEDVADKDCSAHDDSIAEDETIEDAILTGNESTPVLLKDVRDASNQESDDESLYEDNAYDTQDDAYDTQDEDSDNTSALRNDIEQNVNDAVCSMLVNYSQKHF